jgi:alkaline phosphatase
MKLQQLLPSSALAAALAASAFAAPTVSRLTPPSLLFSTDVAGAPYIARFLPGQRFDFQATVQPESGKTITSAVFKVDGVTVSGTVNLISCTQTTSLQSGSKTATLATGSVSATLRAYSNATPGVHTFTVTATQSDSSTVVASGEFQVVGISTTGRKAKNVIVMIGDGMGIAHRTAARIMYKGVLAGKALAPLAMDTFTNTALVETASLNSIIPDSAPGAACYSTGNKSNNNQEGVYPDDTTAKFDNPRVELMGEYLARTQGKALGIVTTADVFDATPGAFGVHTQDRGAGTGICDQYLDEAAVVGGLKVLLGGGRKWFLPSTTAGSARATATDYAHSSELVSGWGVAAGNASDTTRNLISDFQTAGFTYAATKTDLVAVSNSTTKLLGLFSYSNMNVAKDKLDKRRAPDSTGIVDAYGLPDQPMLEEMTDKALKVLKNNANGFVLMVEAASIDKQAHNMDSERWMLETIEFDKAIGVAKQFAIDNPDTLVIITADHECAGVNIIGAATKTVSQIQTFINGSPTTAAAKTYFQGVVGTYDVAGFPIYTLNADGYPQSTDVANRLIIGYAGSADRYEDWSTNAQPLKDSQQPTLISDTTPYSTFPAGPDARDVNSNFFLNGQAVGANSAVHTASDIPLSAFGRGSSLFKGVIDNTDVFFLAAQAAIGGAN